jgi:hypothetical protein
MYNKYKVGGGKFLICDRKVATRLRQLGEKVEFHSTSDSQTGLGFNVIQQSDPVFLDTCQQAYYEE